MPSLSEFSHCLALFILFNVHENQETPAEVITVGLQELEYQHKSFKLLQFLLTLGHKVEGTVAVREGGNMVL